MLPPGPLALMPTLPRRSAAAGAAARRSRGGTSSRNRSSRLWRRCSIRTSGSPRSATASRTRSYGRSSVTATRTVRPSATRVQPARDERRGQRRLALLDLDREDAGPLGEGAEGRRAQEPPGVDGDEEVADPLDLAEQVAGDDDRDPELGAGPPDEREHLVAAGRDRARWSARRAAAAAGRGRAPGRA